MSELILQDIDKDKPIIGKARPPGPIVDFLYNEWRKQSLVFRNFNLLLIVYIIVLLKGLESYSLVIPILAPGSLLAILIWVLDERKRIKAKMDKVLMNYQKTIGGGFTRAEIRAMNEFFRSLAWGNVMAHNMFTVRSEPKS